MHRPGFFSEGLLLVCEEQLCGYIDVTGKVKIPLKFEGARDFSEGLAAARQNGKWGFISKEGKMVIKPAYDQTEIFRNGLAIVIKGQNWGLIDKKGNELTDFSHNRIYYSQGDKTYTLTGKEQTHKALYNPEKGKLTILTDLFLSGGFEEGPGIVFKGDKRGFINEAGKEIIPAIYQDARPFYKGLAAVQKGGFWGVINKKGEIVLPFAFAEISIIDTDIFMAGLHSGWPGTILFGLVNSRGEEILPIKYTRIEHFTDGFASISQNNTMGLINKKGKLVIPPPALPEGYRLCGGWQNGILKICSENNRKNGYLDRYGNRYFAD